MDICICMIYTWSLHVRPFVFFMLSLFCFYNMFQGLNSTCLFLMEVWSDRGSTCKFRDARSAFRNLLVDPLSLHTSMRNKQVEFNPYIYTLTTLSKLYRFGYEYPFFNTKHPVIILRASLFVVTPSHVASWKIECQNFSCVYRSRKHWECKYYIVWLPYTYTAMF